jgi:hypothetical protein
MDGSSDQPAGAEPRSLVGCRNVIGTKQAPQRFGFFGRQPDIDWMLFLHWSPHNDHARCLQRKEAVCCEVRHKKRRIECAATKSVASTLDRQGSAE